MPNGERNSKRDDEEQRTADRWLDRPSRRDSVYTETSNMGMSKPLRMLRRGRHLGRSRPVQWLE